jgi:hypothetical protein
MPSREIEEFAQIIVRHVRDAAIQSCDGQLQPHSNSPQQSGGVRAAFRPKHYPA